MLEKVSSPIGVVLIIFEARPDALPQIASLAIRSGNGLILKGGKEAAKTNACLHSIITSCLTPSCEPELIGLVTSRADIDKLLSMKEYIDLVVPRGSNALVSYIQDNTSIPVLGHADGICHLYLDENVDIAEVRTFHNHRARLCNLLQDRKVAVCMSARCRRCRCQGARIAAHAARPTHGRVFPCTCCRPLQHALLLAHVAVPSSQSCVVLQACKIAVDAKTDYPAACNAVEKILVHRANERNGNIFKLQARLTQT